MTSGFKKMTRRKTTPKSAHGCPGDHYVPRTILKRTHSRLYIIMALFLIAYAAVGLRLANLTLHRQPMDSMRVAALTGKENPLPGRSNIVDRQGHILATSLKTSSLYADPLIVQDPVEAARKLTEVFPDLNYGSLLEQLQSDKRFIWVKRNLTPKQEFAANRLGIPGLHFIEEKRRVYPNGDLAAHVVGYTNIDNKGMMGVERSFDALLSEGKRELQLTIDVRAQHTLEKVLNKTMKEFRALGAAGMVMDIHTGEIIAMASLPDFDPHDPSSSPVANQFNRSTMGVYEMGSTFKIFSTAAVLDLTKTRIHDSFDATKPLHVAGFTINDFHAEKRWMSVPEVFIHSSNIGTARMADRIGTPAMMKFYSDLGLFYPAKLEIDEIGDPLIPYPWRHINTLTASYGHGIAVSPLQLVTAVSAISNGGYLPHPTLVKRPDSSELLKGRHRVVSADTSHTMNQLMRLAVTDGTGRKADIPGYLIGGKTGSAEKASGKGYKHDAILSSFVGVFPTNEPKYVVFAMIDEPKGNDRTYGYATGGWIAAPVVGRVIQGIAPFLGIDMEKDTYTRNIRHTMRIQQKGRRLASF